MKTFYSAYTCKGNVGDLLINKYQIEEYAKYSDVYVDCTGMPDEFRSVILDERNPHVKDFVTTYGMSYRGKNMLKVLSLLKREGFTHFTKSPGPYAVLSFPLKQLLVRLIGAFGYSVASRYGMKVFAMGIDLDYNNLPTWLQRWNINYFNKYDLLGVRSVDNKIRLEQTVKPVMYCPDMAFLCNDLQEPIAENRKRIAISFRKVDKQNELLAHLHWICNNLTPKGYTIDIIYQVEEDAKFCELLYKELIQYTPRYRANIISFHELNEYEQYDYVFSNRLHVLLMGAMHGAIPYAIISNSRKEAKIKFLFDSVFNEKLYMFIDDGQYKLERFITCDRLYLKNSIYECLKEQQDLCKRTIHHLFNK